MPTYLKYGADTLTVNHPRRRGKPLDHEVVQRAAAALADPTVETFTRAQVAFIVAMALDYRGADEWHAGYDYAHAEMVDGFRVALGGDDAKDMSEAVRRHRWALERQRRNARARLPQPGDYRGGPVEWDEPTPMASAA
jgi:hypothetical protein